LINIQRTIETILDLKTGKRIETAVLFENANEREQEIFILRTEIEKQIQTQEIRYVCLYCKKPVALRGRKSTSRESPTFYFSHPYRSPDCIIKTTSNLTEEEIRCIKYNGAKETAEHEGLKNMIASYLRLDKNINEVFIEKTYKDLAVSKNWRRPDVMAILPDKKIAFEIQLSTTFLSVVVARTMFYQQRGVFLIWIFPHFSVESDMQRFTQKDVFYNNSFNVYVFDQDAQDRSGKVGELILSCFYKEHYLENEIVNSRWVKSYIGIYQLSFNSEKYSLHYYDSSERKNMLEAELKKIQDNRLQLARKQDLDQRINACLEYLRELYKSDLDPSSAGKFNALTLITSEEDIEDLNNQLQFTSEKAAVIANLFVNGSKPRFLRFISEQDKIKVRLENVNIGYKSLLEHIVHDQTDYYFEQSITMLFQMGYRLTEKDYSLIDSLYDKHNANYTDYERQCIERWAYISSVKSLITNDQIYQIRSIKRVIFSFMSLKYGLLIGFKFSSFKQLSMNFLEYYQPYGKLYLHALRHYSRYEEHLRNDKNGKLKNKIQLFQQDCPEQNNANDELFYILFPELK